MQPRVIDPVAGLVEEWLRADVTLRGSVIHERLVAELAGQDDDRLSGLHRRFEVVPGAQAQVDWGDEGSILTHAGTGRSTPSI